MQDGRGVSDKEARGAETELLRLLMGSLLVQVPFCLRHKRFNVHRCGPVAQRIFTHATVQSMHVSSISSEHVTAVRLEIPIAGK